MAKLCAECVYNGSRGYTTAKAAALPKCFKHTTGQDINLKGLSKGSFIVGLGVMCSPRDPRFAGSNPAEVDGFFQDVKILSTSPPG